MFTHVQCCDIVPSLVSSFGESLDTGFFFAPQFPRGFDHFYGAGRGGEPPPPHSAGRGGASIPDILLPLVIKSLTSAYHKFATFVDEGEGLAVSSFF